MATASPDEKAIFNDARRIGDADARREFLEQACGGDAALFSRIQKLMDAVRPGSSFLEPPHAATQELTSPASGRPGLSIGPYRFIELLGEGGMGEVWLAEQKEPVTRLVAVKLVKSGRNPQQVLARFDVERQALAVMDHPNIARVLDAGESPPVATGGLSRVPYFVMELVRGVPITDYCDQKHLTPRQRLGLFIPVCQAVQHAHQKGVIHRDLKPSNVLVTEVDGKPVPKVIDFGVAKAIGNKLAGVTMDTHVGAIIGTLEYMSPEQAAPDHKDIDTRSDIYSLGVLLYELLTGTTPLQRKQMKDAAVFEMLRIIREVEPPKPSTRLSTIDELPSVAANRGVEPRTLSHAVKGDLDWIVMKSLDKDRNRRYSTANGLARDIERYLCDEPVEAGPPTAGYRMRKFLRRNRGPVIAATLLLMTLFGGIIGTTVGMKRAEQGQAAAEQSRQVAQHQRDRAERHYQRALSAVDRLLTRVGGVGLESVPHMDETRRRILGDALEFYREILKDEGDDPRVQREIGLAHARMGHIHFIMDRHSEAERSFLRAIEMQQQLIARGEDISRHRTDLSNSRRLLAQMWHRAGRFSEAERIAKDTLAEQRISTDEDRVIQIQLRYLCSWTYAATRRHDESEAECKKALELADDLVRSDPANTNYQYTRIRPLSFLGNLARDRRRLQEAERYFVESRDCLGRLLAQEPDDNELQFNLAITHVNLGLTYANLNRAAEAEASYAQSVSLIVPLVRDHPSLPEYSLHLARTYNNQAGLHSRKGDPVQAAVQNEKALKIFEELLQRFPQRLEFAASFCGGCGNQGKYLREQGRRDEAIHWNTKAIEAGAALLKIEPRHTDTRMSVHGSLIGRAGDYRRLNQMDLAIRDYRRSLELSEGERHVNYVIFRPRALAFVGEHAKATAEAEAVVASANATGSNFKEMADVFAQCMLAVRRDSAMAEAEREPLAERYAVRAIALLTKAGEMGHFPTVERVGDLRTDDRLKPIQDRDDFKKLLTQLENAIPAREKPGEKAKEQ